MSTTTPLKLPSLLASLPKSGKHLLVRPTTFPPDSFYRITRTSLKFRPASSPSFKPQPPKPMYRPRYARQPEGREYKMGDVAAAGEGEAEGAEGGSELRAVGKAYGMLYWKGKYVPPLPSALPDPKIPHLLSYKWQLVDPSALSDSARAAADGWKARYDAHVQRREALWRQRKEQGDRNRVEWKAKLAEETKSREQRLQEKMRVRVLE